MIFGILNNLNKVSKNLLKNEDVKVHQIGDCEIIEIIVPRALRHDRPVYINGDIFNGTYRRNNTGDYRCKREEIISMIRDQKVEVIDSRVLTEMSYSALCEDTIRSYRNVFSYKKHSHVWTKLSDLDFLIKLGAMHKDKDGNCYPTVAGLLFFGHEYEITTEFPHYFLDYQERMTTDPEIRWTDRIYSTTGDWSGNLFDFHTRIYNKLQLDLKTPFALEDNGLYRISETDLHKAIREALTNCVVNADFLFTRGIVVKKYIDKIVLENPGSLRISKEQAFMGGISEPRNETILKMFNLIDIGERAGSGIPTIVNAFEKADLPKPELEEFFSPDRIKFTIYLSKTSDKKQAIKTSDKKQAIINYVQDKKEMRTIDIAKEMGLSLPRTRFLLKELINDDIIVGLGANRNRTYKIKKDFYKKDI